MDDFMDLRFGIFIHWGPVTLRGTEIITKYDPYMLWFDGNWEKPWTAEHTMDVYTFIKQLNPNVIINNRLKNVSEVKDAGDDHVLLRPGSIGDYANKLYIRVFERKSDQLVLPALPDVKVRKAYFLKGNKTGWSQDTNGTVTVELTQVLPNADASVIVLELNSTAGDIPVIS